MSQESTTLPHIDIAEKHKISFSKLSDPEKESWRELEAMTKAHNDNPTWDTYEALLEKSKEFATELQTNWPITPESTAPTPETKQDPPKVSNRDQEIAPYLDFIHSDHKNVDINTVSEEGFQTILKAAKEAFEKSKNTQTTDTTTPNPPNPPAAEAEKKSIWGFDSLY